MAEVFAGVCELSQQNRDILEVIPQIEMEGSTPSELVEWLQAGGAARLRERMVDRGSRIRPAQMWQAFLEDRMAQEIEPP